MPVPLKELEAAMREVGHAIGDSMPSGAGFLLVTFDFGDGGNMSYMSNANREDVLALLAELREKLSQPDAPFAAVPRKT